MFFEQIIFSCVRLKIFYGWTYAIRGNLSLRMPMEENLISTFPLQRPHSQGKIVSICQRTLESHADGSFSFDFPFVSEQRTCDDV